MACLRRIDAGDAIDAVLRDRPEDATWLHDHLIVSGALQMAERPSAEQRTRALQSLLSAVAHSDPPAIVARAPRFGFALGSAVFIILLCLGLTAGAATASGLNLRSVARDVVDTLVEPLPVSAPPLLQAEAPGDPIGFDPDEVAADDTTGGKRPAIQPDGGSAAGSDATPSSSPSDAVSEHTNVLVEAGPLDQNPPADTPESNGGNPDDDDPPSGEDDGGDHGAPPDDDDPPSGENHGGDDEAPPGDTGPPSPTPTPGGPPGGNGQPGSGGPGNNGPPGGNGSNGNGSNGGQPGGSGGNPSNGSGGSNGNPSNSGDGGGSHNGGGSGGSGGSNPGGKGGGGNKGGGK
jgi:uncharacterized membrane protein YgcG